MGYKKEIGKRPQRSTHIQPISLPEEQFKRIVAAKQEIAPDKGLSEFFRDSAERYISIMTKGTISPLTYSLSSNFVRIDRKNIFYRAERSASPPLDPKLIQGIFPTEVVENLQQLNKLMGTKDRRYSELLAVWMGAASLEYFAVLSLGEDAFHNLGNPYRVPGTDKDEFIVDIGYLAEVGDLTEYYHRSKLFVEKSSILVASGVSICAALLNMENWDSGSLSYLDQVLDLCELEPKIKNVREKSKFVGQCDRLWSELYVKIIALSREIDSQ